MKLLSYFVYCFLHLLLNLRPALALKMYKKRWWSGLRLEPRWESVTGCLAPSAFDDPARTSPRQGPPKTAHIQVRYSGDGSGRCPFYGKNFGARPYFVLYSLGKSTPNEQFNIQPDRLKSNSSKHLLSVLQ